MISCGDKPGEKETLNRETSRVGIVDLGLASVSNISEKGNFPYFFKKYQMTATLIDQNTNRALPLTDVDILLENEKITVKSDITGRIYWNEYISYKLTTEKKRILIEREIIDHRSQNTFGKAIFSLYPYAEHLNENISEFIIGRNDNNLDVVKKMDAIKLSSNKVSIESKNGFIKFDYLGPSVAGSQFNIKFQSEIIAALNKQNGEEIDYKIKNGLFNVLIELESERDGVFYQKELINTELINGQISFSFKDYIKYSQKFSQISVNLHLFASENWPDLEDFFGKIKLGKLSKLDGEHSLTFSEKFNSRYTQFKFQKNKNLKNVTMKYRSLKFSPLRATYIMRGAGETAIDLPIVYDSTTCVRDYYDDEELSGEEFLVTKTDGSIISVIANDEGCLSWSEKITVRYYKPERLFERANKVVHINSGISENVISLINPWTILTLGINTEAKDDDLKKEIKARGEIGSKLFLGEFYFETLSVTYEIDKYMTLSVRKNVELDLDFFALRYSSITEGYKAKESLRDGIYLLKIGVLKNYIDTRNTFFEVKQKKYSTTIQKSLTRKPLEYIYIVEKLVKVKNGRVQTQVEFAINDLRLMTVRSNMLIQLEIVDPKFLELSQDYDETYLDDERILSLMNKYFPKEKESLNLFIHPDSGLPARTFVGPMVLLKMEDTAGVLPTDSLVECRTNDCNFAERNNENVTKRSYTYDKKYYGTLNHLRQISVDDLIEQKKILDLKYTNTKTIESLLYNYLKTFGLLYVTDDDEPLYSLPTFKEEFNCPSNNVDDCLVENNSIRVTEDELLSKFEATSWRIKHVPESLADLFNESHINDYTYTLCENLIEKMKLNPKVDGVSEFKIKVMKNELYHDLQKLCVKIKPFSFTKIVRNQGIKSFDFLGGKTINFDLGSSISLDYSESYSTAATMNVEGKLLSLFGKAGKAISDVMGISYSISGSSGTSFSYGDSSGLTSNTYLAMQRATYDIKFKEPTLCLEIKMREEFGVEFLERLKRDKYLNVDLDSIFYGYLVCSKKQSYRVEDREFRERFYYFAQHFTEGHMLDDGSILNHAWLLALRGERDYVKFIKLLEIKPTTESRDMGMFTQFFQKVTENYLDDSKKLSYATKKNDIAELPLDQISQAYDNVLPSFPGIYVVRPEKREYPYDQSEKSVNYTD